MAEETVLITGCSSGIGRATARAFLEEEWTVYATARNPDDVAALAEAGCETAALDVTDPEECAAVVEQVIEETGRLDCLVNNAGYGQVGSIEDVPPRLVRRQFDVNVFGPHRLVREALPHMREAEDGTVVNVSSVQGFLAVPGMGTYAASKFALEGLSDALRREVEPQGVDVAVVEPGPVDTAFQDRSTDSVADVDRGEAYEDLYEFHEDRRTVTNAFANTPAEVAATVLEAASSTDPAARYPVGSVAHLSRWVRFLPDAVVDTLYRFLRRVA